MISFISTYVEIITVRFRLFEHLEQSIQEWAK